MLTLAVLALAMISAGCSHGGSGVARRPSASHGRRVDGPVQRLVVARSTWLHGEPGGVAVDEAGVVAEIDERVVVALDTHGFQQWSEPVAGAAMGWPLLVGGLVVVPTTNAIESGAGDTGPDNSGGCVALDRATGARRWSYEEGTGSGVAVASGGGSVFCLLDRGVMAALDPGTGDVRWRALPFASEPRGVVSVSERTAIAVDITTGTVSFTGRLGQTWVLVVRDLATGADRGVFGLGKTSPSSAPASVGPGLIAFGAESARVCTFDIAAKRVVGCVEVPAANGFDPAAIPVVAGGLLVIAARGGEVTAVDLGRRRVRWSTTMPEAILDSRPSISSGVVLFADWTRAPWALRLADGSEIGLRSAEGFVIATSPDQGGGFALAIRGEPNGRVERWVPGR